MLHLILTAVLLLLFLFFFMKFSPNLACKPNNKNNRVRRLPGSGEVSNWPRAV